MVRTTCLVQLLLWPPNPHYLPILLFSPPFQVFLAGIKTCLFSGKTSPLPSVLLCLLDFEPLVFEGLQRGNGGLSEDASTDNNNGDGREGRHPVVFSCSKGKSCVFEADTARLSKALRIPDALMLMVASKLSKRQVCSKGKKGCEGPSAVLKPILFTNHVSVTSLSCLPTGR